MDWDIFITLISCKGIPVPRDRKPGLDETGKPYTHVVKTQCLECNRLPWGRNKYLHGAITDGRLPDDLGQIVGWSIDAGNNNPDGQEQLINSIKSIIKGYEPGVKWVDLQKKEKEAEEHFNTNYEFVGDCLHISSKGDAQREFYNQTEYIVFGKAVWRKKDE